MPLDKVDITLRELLRYGYGGVLAFLVAAVITPTDTKAVVEALGTVLAPLAAFALGAGIYVFNKAVIGDMIFDPLAHRIHRCLEPSWGYDSNKRSGYSCRTHLLEERFKVPRAQCREAFRVVRDSRLFSAELRRRFHVQHSEVHLLYVTATLMAAAAIFLVVAVLTSNSDRLVMTCVFAAIGLLALFFGLVADIDLCRQECAHILTLNGESVRSELEKAELSQQPEDAA